MHYLIDGHNLIGKMPEIGLDHPAKELRLIERLMQFCSRRQRDSCAIIFDRGLPGGRKPRLGNSQVKVSFAHSATNADRLIMARIRKESDPGAMTVVSDDWEVRDAALQRRMRVISATDFARLLSAPAPSTTADEKDPNPTLSPQEKAYWLAEFGVEDDE